MKSKIIYKGNNRHLLLFFSGWGTDEKIITIPGSFKADTDICVVWDYTDPAFDISILSEYEKIYLIAWSMGVWNADMVFSAIDFRLKKSIAINGTPKPIDDREGIPELIFNGTLETLNEDNLIRFYRRMCGSAKAMNEFIAAHKPDRDIESLKTELSEIGKRYDEVISHSNLSWNKCIIGENDKIFPAENQRRYWDGHSRISNIEITVNDGAHYAEFISSPEKLIELIK